MSDIAIRVDHLGKQYRIGGKQAASRNFQETLLASLAAPVRWIRGDRQSFETFWALDDVSFEIKQGEAVGIIGRNGAGKSTLLKILSRITKPTKGRVELYGRVATLLEVGTGFHSELSGRDNIYLNGAILGMGRKEIDRKFDEIVDFSGVEKFLDTPVKHYSSGMYVRLAFAVAAHLEPEILIVDEVLAVGDAEFQKKCLGKMSDVAQEGRTVLFVSHNMQAIERLCTRAVLLGNGQVIGNGLTSEVVINYLESIPRAEAHNQIPELIMQLPTDPNFQLVDAKITQNGLVLNQPALNGEPIKVIIEYEVKKKTTNFRVYLDILDNDGTLLIKNFHDCDSPTATIAEPGKYISEVIIPNNFLAPKEYLLRIGATVFGDRQLAGQEGLCLNLNVRKAGRVNRGYTLAVEVGKLAPLFEWKTKRIF